MACTLRVALPLLALFACQRVPGDDSMPIIPDPGTGTDTATTGPDDPSTPTEPGGEVGNEPVFGCEPGDNGSCPMGQKCTALSSGGFQNRFECVNDDGTLLVDEDCTPAPPTGQDQCSAGSVCLTDSLDDTLGSCLELCNSDADCEPGKCMESPHTLTPFCADSCDPLLPDCPPGRACQQTDDRFACGMPLPDDINDAGKPCDPVNLRGCAEGYACLTGSLIPGCASPTGSCCTNVCDQSAGDGDCAAPALCKPLFPEPAPGFETLGACYVPA